MALCCSHARAPLSTHEAPQSSCVREWPRGDDVGLNAAGRTAVLDLSAFAFRRAPYRRTSMRRLGLAAALALAAACAPSRDDLTVDWTFAGKTCADAGVAFIEVHIDGEVLSPDKFTCAEAGKGAYLGRYLIGRYTLTVSGLDASSSVIYQTSVQVDVRRGGTEVAVDAAPSTTNGSATLHWTFDGKSCAAAGVTVINASVDNQVLTDVNNNADLPCTNGGKDGISVAPLTN